MKEGKVMKTIMVYETDAERIDTVAEENNMTAAELIECLLDMIEDGDIEI